MNRTEIVQLCRLVKAVCPSQAIDQFTPDALADREQPDHQEREAL